MDGGELGETLLIGFGVAYLCASLFGVWWNWFR